jgi:para-aminobenzoate synthetase/4-amino-4-deoxychorismate lyase
VSDAVTINPDDPLQRHKTTRRHHYDALLAAAVAEGLFDAVVMNRRGELVEGCRSTLFVRFPGSTQLLTPRLASGCLAGTLRAKLLAEGVAREARLTPDMLMHAEAIFLGNALNGLLPAQWVAAMSLRTLSSS